MNNLSRRSLGIPPTSQTRDVHTQLGGLWGRWPRLLDRITLKMHNEEYIRINWKMGGPSKQREGMSKDLEV